MPRRLEAGTILALLALPVAAEPAGCFGLAAVFEGLTGYVVQAPPAARAEEWCVFDHAALRADRAPDLDADRLRLRGVVEDGALTLLALELGGARLAPGLSRRKLDPMLREMLRLQSVEARIVLTLGPEGVALRDGWIGLSGGTDLSFEADLAGAGLSAEGLVSGRLTRLALGWRNDGRLFRAPMEAAGAALKPGASGPQAVDAARDALRALVADLPEAAVAKAVRAKLAQLIDALPQGRGRLALRLTSPGIGAAQLGLLALADDPAGPEALARLFEGAELVVDWQPGLRE